MNYSKLVLVGFISAFVAILTSVLGVAGTIIGSVISSVLYNMLSEALEKPVQNATFSTNFEWEIAYIFPIVVIALIQVLFILALLSDWGLLPYSFLSVYLSLQGVANNNLYRILGFALLVISAYPLVLKPDIIKKSHGLIIAFVGLVFLARGFVDFGNRITELYSPVFAYFDLPIAIVALVLLVFVILNILRSARESEKEFNVMKKNIDGEKPKNDNIIKVHNSKPKKDFNHNARNEKSVEKYSKPNRNVPHKKPESNVRFRNSVETEHSQSGINESSGKIHFESNDLLDDYKK